MSVGRGVIARVALAMGAVLVIGWLVVLERDLRLTSRASHSSQNPTAAIDDLRRARLLNPDRNPDILRAALYIGLNQSARAVSILKKVVSDEPDNLAAWNYLRIVGHGKGLPIEGLAIANLRRLDPLETRGLRVNPGRR